MSVLQGAADTTINGGTSTAVSNTWGNPSTSNDIVDILHSCSATAGLLDAEERFDAPKCDNGTRVSMLGGMKKFVQEGGPSSSAAMCWLHGPAEVGTSALSQSLALSLKDKGDHAASFFFSHTAPGRSDGNQLVVTLTYQLAINFPALQPFILKTVKENPAVLTASNTVKMQNLIINPINEWQGRYNRSVRRWAHKIFHTGKKLHPRLILVNGLDECNNPQVQQELILCIALAVRQLSLPFRFVITSRPESHILATFDLDPIFQGPYGVKVLSKNLGGDEDVDEQITTYLLKEFAEIRRTHPVREYLPQPWPIPEQIAQLVAKSSKRFIYPATVIRYIKMKNNKPEECLKRILALSGVPIRERPYEPLDILYRYIFESAPDANKEAIRNIFHFLVAPNSGDEFITPHFIEQCFNYEPGHIQHVLRDLVCIVVVTGETIKVLHDSLPDFLLDQSRSDSLYINIGDAHATIAATLPLALSTTVTLPDFTLVGFLEHMMQANMSTRLIHCYLVDVDLRLRYEMLPVVRSFTNKAPIPMNVYLQRDVERLAFVTVYFLVLVIKNVSHADIRKRITVIKTSILQKCPLAASLYAVRNELLPAMIPLFRKWTSSTIDKDFLDYILAFEVPAFQREISEEILELQLLMLSPFFGRITEEEDYPRNISRQTPAQWLLTRHSNIISLTLLSFIFRSPSSALLVNLQLLATNLLGMSLAHSGYSRSLTTILRDLIDPLLSVAFDMRIWLSILVPSVTDYLKRVYSEAPAESQQKILELNNTWMQYPKRELKWYEMCDD
ncbi:hypothetical protein D9619_004053 [Psilocybe cf. subviscida]|uniref:Nephrocystin 3-like N-terminal domain-containing protein n=1 Tax=Psilocybe cf. subviscida TaxID=2480587 RepID=A0A8H5F8C5_9AGAR|nr:hypothetical protein D9619_004053 [Psilocybe cf. subviscida]